jgi:hypothetical protein
MTQTRKKFYFGPNDLDRLLRDDFDFRAFRSTCERMGYSIFKNSGVVSATKPTVIDASVTCSPSFRDSLNKGKLPDGGYMTFYKDNTENPKEMYLETFHNNRYSTQYLEGPQKPKVTSRFWGDSDTVTLQERAVSNTPEDTSIKKPGM